MKLQDLFEYAPQAIKVMAKRSAAGEKLAKLRGTIPDWLAAINDHMKEPITTETVAAVRPKIKDSKEYKALIAAGYKDVSSERHERVGSFSFTFDDSSEGGRKYSRTITCLVTGKMNDRTSYGGGEHAAPVPRIVPTDPEATLIKTMLATFAHLKDYRENDPDVKISKKKRDEWDKTYRNGRY